MKLYADLPARRTAQVIADLAMLGWVWLWVWAATKVHAVTMELTEPGRRLAGAGSGFRDKMTSAGDRVDDLPLVEDRVAAPFREAAGAGTDIERAGTDLVTAVERLSLALALVTALVPILLALLWWGLTRYRFVRTATAAQRLIDADADLDLFALRAMANQPMTRLAAVSPDPAGAWRRGEIEIVRALALLELRDAGLRPPGSRPPLA
ncbi:hypothetical protein JNO54_09315 [Janibacter sp. YIM B02568]|uniref:hypothetical protein n=1 Tax=Janibacter endophyticus TaxID=2806261 RepID=UPI00195219E5|nr:hypothetical protein [Janibacter endophyticus]MBM6546336.1 hypothetical protein [Janibacter endophyticus]